MKNAGVSRSPSFIIMNLKPLTQLVKVKNAELSHCPSFTIVDLKPDKRLKIDQTRLIQLVIDKNVERLRKLGGVDGVASSLEATVEFGIQADAEDIALRHEAFGSNTYKRPPAKSFFHFVVETFKDLTIFILLGCATLSLAFGIKEHGIKEGW
jgi:Ca2+-transporting ATPase